jgi:hypothetical protein
MRKKAILIAGLALLIALAGVVYAHWTETLYVDATVNTGTAYVRWVNIFTDDDSGNSIGEETGFLPPVWSVHNPAQSPDPSSAGYPTFATRYDKDVAGCWSGISDGGGLGYHMTVTAGQVYPSYNCTIWSYFQNQGTVPMKVQAINLTYTAGAIPDEIEWDTLNGTWCGYQLDPQVTDYTVNWFHVLQAADEGDTYTLHQEITWVNWNEWDIHSCVYTINGTPYAYDDPAFGAVWGIEP